MVTGRDEPLTPTGWDHFRLMNHVGDDVEGFRLIGSIQNSVGMGFLGNQAALR